MTPEEINLAIEITKEKIWEIRSRLEKATSVKEKQELKKRLKELQILQLWHLDQLG